jgi:CBS domain-containing protein
VKGADKRHYMRDWRDVMKTENLMRPKPASCPGDATLETVVSTMRTENTGFVPIINMKRQVIGVVTARDAAVALGAGNRRPSEVRASDAMTMPVVSCEVTETVQTALQRMARAQVRRLPVVDAAGTLVGVLSLGDVIPVAQGVRAGVDRLSYEQIMEALNGIYAR